MAQARNGDELKSNDLLEQFEGMRNSNGVTSNQNEGMSTTGDSVAIVGDNRAFIENSRESRSHTERCRCGCVPNMLSLFEMAALRAERKKKMLSNTKPWFITSPYRWHVILIEYVQQSYPRHEGSTHSIWELVHGKDSQGMIRRILSAMECFGGHYQLL